MSVYKSFDKRSDLFEHRLLQTFCQIFDKKSNSFAYLLTVVSGRVGERLGINNKSTLLYQRKNLVEGKTIKVYRKVLAKLR